MIAPFSQRGPASLLLVFAGDEMTLLIEMVVDVEHHNSCESRCVGHPPRRRRMTANCAFETFARRLEST